MKVEVNRLNGGKEQEQRDKAQQQTALRPASAEFSSPCHLL